MNTVAKYNHEVIVKHNQGVDVTLGTVILKIIKDKQRCPVSSLQGLVYKAIGEEYKSPDFDTYIQDNVGLLLKSNRIICKDNLYLYRF